MNPLEETARALFSRLNIINGYLFQLVNRIESHTKRLKEFYGKNDEEVNRLFSGSSLVISDISEWPEDEWRRNYSTGGFFVKGEEYLNFAEELIQREAAFSVALGYETLETFMKNICTKFIMENPKFVDTKKYNKYRTRHAIASSIEFWHDYITETYRGRNNRALLKYIRKISPLFEKLEEDNNRCLSFSDWFEVSSLVRHSVIHSNSNIKAQELSNLTGNRKSILKYYFPGEYGQNGYIVKLDKKNANNQLVRIAEYGFLIFKCLSITANYEWDIYAFRKPPERFKGS